MSHVTNAILAFDVMDDDMPLERINAGINGKGFTTVDDPELPYGWYGGDKFLETPLLIGAFNYLDIDGLLRHLAALPWQHPERVQLIVKDDNDDRFSILYPAAPEDPPSY